MKLKLAEMEEGGGRSVAVLDGERWVALAPLSEEPWARDLLAFLAGGDGVREAATALVDGAEAAPLGDRALLPFVARSFRDFSIYPEHMESSARTLAKRFFPKPAGAAIGGFERVTGRTFPAIKPKASMLERPAYYMGNHTAFVADGETVTWPAYTDFLDYELELGLVIARPVADATAAEGEAAIGGLMIVNDWSARDTQADEYRHGVFGPVVKTKSFANSLGAVVVTADELLGRWDSLRAAVRVNGETWSETSTAGAAHSLGDLVARASEGERLDVGDVLATGTVPRGCGLELDRWVQPGDVVELEIEGLGTLSNPLGSRG
jgi:2-keto-4-pentenoate hydratase/2-oxohepta-3-ene-1,7-dioic acid hydratase in catechol pathway